MRNTDFGNRTRCRRDGTFRNRRRRHGGHVIFEIKRLSVFFFQPRRSVTAAAVDGRGRNNVWFDKRRNDAVDAGRGNERVCRREIAFYRFNGNFGRAQQRRPFTADDHSGVGVAAARVLRRVRRQSAERDLVQRSVLLRRARCYRRRSVVRGVVHRSVEPSVVRTRRRIAFAGTVFGRRRLLVVAGDGQRRELVGQRARGLFPSYRQTGRLRAAFGRRILRRPFVVAARHFPHAVFGRRLKRNVYLL